MSSFEKSSQEFSKSAVAEAERIASIDYAQSLEEMRANQTSGTDPHELVGEQASYALDFIKHMSSDEIKMPGATELSLGGKKSVKAYQIGMFGQFPQQHSKFKREIINKKKLSIDSELSLAALNTAQPEWFIDQNAQTRANLSPVYLCEDGKLRLEDGKNIPSKNANRQFVPGVTFKTKHKPDNYRLYAAEQDRFYHIPLERLLPAITFSKLEGEITKNLGSTAIAVQGLPNDWLRQRDDTLDTLERDRLEAEELKKQQEKPEKEDEQG